MSVGEGVANREHLHTVGGNIHCSSYFGKQYGSSLNNEKLELNQLSHFWVYIQRKWNQYLQEISASLFTAALFTVTKIWKKT